MKNLEKANIGEFVMLSNHKYLVIKKTLNKITLMDTERIIVTRTNASVKNRYENSDLDTYLEDCYYNSLPFKDLIVSDIISQNVYYKNPLGNIKLDDRNAFIKHDIPVGTFERKVYAPSISDLEALYKTGRNIEELLSPEHLTFSFRSIFPKTKRCVWGVSGRDEGIQCSSGRELIATKPVFSLAI